MDEIEFDWDAFDREQAKDRRVLSLRPPKVPHDTVLFVDGSCACLDCRIDKAVAHFQQYRVLPGPHVPECKCVVGDKGPCERGAFWALRSPDNIRAAEQAGHCQHCRTFIGHHPIECLTMSSGRGACQCRACQMYKEAMGKPSGLLELEKKHVYRPRAGQGLHQRGIRTGRGFLQGGGCRALSRLQGDEGLREPIHQGAVPDVSVMSEYHKINSLFMRDPATKNKRFILGQYADPAFEYLKDALWDGTEKIDGTNIRVTWDGAAVTFGGKTDNAQIPAKLVTVLQEMFKPELLLRVLGEKGGVTLYGEGYGSGIQTGGNYRPDQSLILFDIAVGGVFWERLKVQDTAKALGILFVPVLGTETLAGWLDIARNGFKSNLNLHAQAEGVVLRPVVELRTRLGARVITKLKHKDFV